MRLSRGALIRLGIPAIVVIAAFAALWFGRGPAAGFVGERVLALQGVESKLNIRDVGLGGVRAGPVRLGPEDAPGVKAEALEIDFTLKGFAGLSLDRVSADGLQVRAESTPTGLRILGLPEGGGGKADGPAAALRPPALDIEAARVSVATPAGDLTGRLDATGDETSGWSVALAFEPATLVRDAASLTLDEGSASARLVDGRLEAAAALNVRDAVDGEARVAAASVVAAFSGEAPETNDLLAAEGQGFVRASADGAALPPDRVAAWLGALGLAGQAETPDAPDGVLDAHISALVEAISAAATGFDAEGQLAVRVADRAAEIVVETPVSVRATDGASVLVETGATARLAWSDTEPEAWTLDALGLVLRGGTAGPSGALAIASAAGRDRGDRAEMTADGVLRLEPWTADGLSLGLDDVRFSAAQRGAVRTLTLKGGAAFAGKRPGFDVNRGRLDVDLSIVDEGGDLAVSAGGPGGPAIAFEASRLAVGETKLASVKAAIAAPASGEPLVTLQDERAVANGRLQDAEASLKLGEATHRFVAPAAEIALETGGDRPTTLDVRAQGARAELGVGAGLAADARIVNVAASVGDVTTLKATLDAVEIVGPGAPVRVRDAAAQADLAFDAEGRASGKITLARGEIGDAVAPARFTPVAVTGVVDLVEGRASGEASARWGKLGEAASARFSHDLSSGEGSARFETVRIAFAPGGLQPADLAPMILGDVAQVRGAVRVNGRASWDDDAALAPMTLTIEDLDFESAAGRVQGLSTTFALADAIGLRSEGPQDITIDLFDPGLPLPDGRFQVELTGGGAGRLFEARFPYAGGELVLEPIEFIPGDADQRGALTASDLDLVELVGQFDVPDLVATGRVGGRVQFVFSERSVIVDGVLRSREPGEIRYTSEKASQLANTAEGAKIAFQALQELDYDTLELTIGGDLNGEMTMRMFAAGRSPQVYGGAPVEFTANFGGELARLVSRAARALDPGAILKERREQDEKTARDTAADERGEP